MSEISWIYISLHGIKHSLLTKIINDHRMISLIYKKIEVSLIANRWYCTKNESDVLSSGILPPIMNGAFKLQNRTRNQL